MPSPMKSFCCVFGLIAPSLCFRAAAFPNLALVRRPKTHVSAVTRAEYVGGCAAAVIAVATAPPSSSATTPTTVVNSVLAGYGVPMISDDNGKFTSSYFKFGEGEQAIICAFAFPASWVEVTKKDGLSAANYQTGDGLIFSAGAPRAARTIGDVSTLDIVAEATPSGGVAKVLQEVPVTKGGVNYTYLTVKYNTVTRSGYDVERMSYIAATVRQRKLFTLAATCSSERRNKMEVALTAVRASFRVGDAGVVRVSD